MWFAAAAAAEPTVTPELWVRAGYVAPGDHPAVGELPGFVAEARAGVEGTAGPLSARIELDLLPTPTLTDAWVQAAPTSWLALRVGQFKPPFSAHLGTPETRRQLGTGPQLLAGFDREIGASVELSVPVEHRNRVTFSSAVFNGEGPNQLQNANERVMLVESGRVTPFGPRSPMEGSSRDLYLGVGGGWVYDFDGTGISAVESNTFGADVQLCWRELSLQAEVIDTEVVHADAALLDYHARGAYVQIGSFVPVTWLREHVEAVFRYEENEPDNAWGQYAGEGFPEWQRVRVFTTGVNLYAMERAPRFHDLKLQLAWERTTATEGDPLLMDGLFVVAQGRLP